MLLIFWLAKLVLKKYFTLGVPVHQQNTERSFHGVLHSLLIKNCRRNWEFAEIVFFFIWSITFLVSCSLGFLVYGHFCLILTI